MLTVRGGSHRLAISYPVCNGDGQGLGDGERLQATAMKPRYNPQENNVLARCPDCDAVTSFDTSGHGNTILGAVIINGRHQYNGQPFSRILWQFFRCNVCSRGAVAKIHDDGHSQTAAQEDSTPEVHEVKAS